ncbi:MAG TPA: AI-2E family transporter [Magnetospirillaceae bacterium]|nr:AI-2E family transporter [Magnetospirillaceae bacterium]
MRVTVDVETKTVVRVLVAVGIFVGLIFMVRQLWPALILVLISIILALALNQPISMIANKLPGQNRVLATSAAFLVVLVVLGTFIYVAVPPVVDQTTKFVQNLPEYVEGLRQRGGPVADFINHYGLQDQVDQLVLGAQQQAGNIAQGVGTSVVNGIASFFNGFVTILTILVLTFLMLVEGPRWVERFWNLYSNDEQLERHQRLATKMYRVVSGYVNGQVVVAGIAAAVGLATLLILTSLFPIPVSAVIPLTGIIFITDLIPLIGATIGAVLIITVLLFSDPTAALIFLIYFVIYQQIENNFIQPLVQSRTVALSALSVLVALILGITLLGLLGGILAIPLAGCIRVLLLDYMEHRKHKATPKKGLFARIANKEEAA